MRLRLLMISLALAACGGSPSNTAASPTPPPTTLLIGGDLTLQSGTSIAHPDGDSGVCFGRSGYSDIVAGAPVTVRDSTGKVVGTSSLGPGNYTGSSFSCFFTWSASVPPSDFYQVEVSRRGALTVSQTEAVARRINMTLGR